MLLPICLITHRENMMISVTKVTSTAKAKFKQIKEYATHFKQTVLLSDAYFVMIKLHGNIYTYRENSFYGTLYTFYRQ